MYGDFDLDDGEFLFFLWDGVECQLASNQFRKNDTISNKTNLGFSAKIADPLWDSNWLTFKSAISALVWRNGSVNNLLTITLTMEISDIPMQLIQFYHIYCINSKIKY